MPISPNRSNSIRPITGTKYNDILNGTGGDDIIDAGKGNDRIQAYKAYGNTGAQFDQLTGGAGADAFVLTDEWGNPGYLNDDYLATSGSRGFALIKDFEASLDAAKDTIELDGYASHYRLIGVSSIWNQDFGKANTSQFTDVAVVYIGAEQDKQDVVAVLQDVSTKMLTNPSGYLNNDSVFRFLG